LLDIGCQVSTFGGVLGMTVRTYASDTGSGSTTVDGTVRRTNATGETWSTMRDGAGSGGSNDDGATVDVDITTHDSTSGRWIGFYRVIMTFDTSDLTALATISAATLDIVLDSSDHHDNFSDSLSLVGATPASDNVIVDADYTQLGTTKFATDLALAGLTYDQATATTLTFVAAGLSAIDKTGITGLGLRMLRDLADNEPSWSGGKKSRLHLAAADETWSGDRWPVLSVTFTMPFTPKVMMF
jgi:hypothetical protein